VFHEENPYEKFLGKEIGKTIGKLHTEHGVKLHSKNGVKEIKGEKGKAKSVVLNDGTELQAELVILGTGVKPAT